MIAKEWLEDIKERFAKYQTDYNLNDEDVEWLIQQVERLEKENKRLREALEFYADENSYRKIGFAELYSPAEKDFGQKARQALEGTE